MTRWVDSHCHLQLAGGDAFVARALDAGVGWMVCVGTDVGTSREALELAGRHEPVLGTVGLHPHEASRLADEWPALEKLAGDDACVAIGECGFDLYYEHSPRAEQERAFRRQIQLAHALDKPLVIHCRDAWDDTFRVLDDEGVPAGTVFHCFTGGAPEAQDALDRGCWLSFSGIVSFKNAELLRDAARLAPADRILVETDAPFLTPEPYRGMQNEPAFVALVGAAVAAAREESVEDVAAVTRANAEHVFRP